MIEPGTEGCICRRGRFAAREEPGLGVPGVDGRPEANTRKRRQGPPLAGGKPDSQSFEPQAGGPASVGLPDHGVASSTADSVMVTAVSPGQPPFIAGIYANPPAIWPHNKKMVSVALTVNASDSTGHAAVCRIIAVGANESIPSSDWKVTGGLTVDLRAEGAHRVYVITVRCTDAAGLYSTKNVEVPIGKPPKK